MSSQFHPLQTRDACRLATMRSEGSPPTISEETAVTLPEYKELPVREGLPPGSAWGVWGDDDELGAINLQTPDRVRAAAALVTSGDVFSLNLPLDQPGPPLWGRSSLEHRISRMYDLILDDTVDNLFTQGSTQWDALSHVGHPQYGFYNGRTPEDFTGDEGTKNGIEHWARRGIAGRGVLLDLPRHFERAGRTLDAGDRIDFTPADLDAACADQGVTFEVGDILLLRTGWMQWYLEQSPQVRQELGEDSIGRLKSPGLSGGEDMAEWLWNKHVSAVAADNPGVEAWPHGVEVDKYLHFRVLPLLGIPLGELWFLDDLAAACESDGKYQFLVTSAPLNLRGGTGSPANVLAIK